MSQLSPFPDKTRLGFAGRMAVFFIDSKLTPIVVAASLLLGLFAILPRLRACSWRDTRSPPHEMKTF